MRAMWLMAILPVLAQGAFCDQAQPPKPAGQLVREVVYNELHDHQVHSYWRYWIERHSQNQTIVENQVETAQGPITMLTERDGLPLSKQGEQLEEARLQHLLASPEEQAHRLKQYEEDEQRVGRILALLPDAFLYEYDGSENGSYRLRFRPNPDYMAQTIEARVFHAMGGVIWIDARSTRLVRLEGRIQENVDFGFGILGRLYQGGWFRLQRVQVSPTDWKTEGLEIHLTVRALLVKSFARETSETRGGFEPVPMGLNLAQGMVILEQHDAQHEAQTEAQPQATRSLAAPVVFKAQR
jgi:hypothetical protein